jgi:hypothetical protein
MLLNHLYLEEFRNTMRNAGLLCQDPILPDGELHRFKPEGDSEPNGWYVLHVDHQTRRFQVLLGRRKTCWSLFLHSRPGGKNLGPL